MTEKVKTTLKLFFVVQPLRLKAFSVVFENLSPKCSSVQRGCSNLFSDEIWGQNIRKFSHRQCISIGWTLSLPEK